MLKILHIHPDQRMAKKFLYPLMKEENRLGYHTKLIVSKKYDSNSLVRKINLNILNVLLPFEILKFIFFIYKYKPDIVFFHNSIQSLLPIVFSRLIKIEKRIYFNHGVPYLGYKGILRYTFLLIEIINMYLTDKTLTVSEDMKYYLNKIKKYRFNLSWFSLWYRFKSF